MFQGAERFSQPTAKIIERTSSDRISKSIQTLSPSNGKVKKEISQLNVPYLGPADIVRQFSGVQNSVRVP